MKKCSKCKKILNLDNFSKDNRYIGGFQCWCKKCIQPFQRAYARRIKIEVFNHYGGSICKCCGETEMVFLSLDHINNDGAQDRKKHIGDHLYYWLRKEGFPDKHRFQVLCMNCQWGKRFNNICPHQKK